MSLNKRLVKLERAALERAASRVVENENDEAVDVNAPDFLALPIAERIRLLQEAYDRIGRESCPPRRRRCDVERANDLVIDVNAPEFKALPVDERIRRLQAAFDAMD